MSVLDLYNIVIFLFMTEIAFVMRWHPDLDRRYGI